MLFPRSFPSHTVKVQRDERSRTGIPFSSSQQARHYCLGNHLCPLLLLQTKMPGRGFISGSWPWPIGRHIYRAGESRDKAAWWAAVCEDSTESRLSSSSSSIKNYKDSKAHAYLHVSGTLYKTPPPPQAAATMLCTKGVHPGDSSPLFFLKNCCPPPKG